jgi:hypothetical protein
MIFALLRSVRTRPDQHQSTLVALAGAAGVAIAGAIVWGLVALLIHKQLSLIGLAIGLGVGALVARFRHAHLPTMIAGAVIAVAGCALGTLLGQIFLLLSAQVSPGEIFGHLNLVLRAYPSNVGWLGVLFYALAAYGAIRVPLRASRNPVPPGQPSGPGAAAGGAVSEGNGGL